MKKKMKNHAALLAFLALLPACSSGPADGSGGAATPYRSLFYIVENATTSQEELLEYSLDKQAVGTVLAASNMRVIDGSLAMAKGKLYFVVNDNSGPSSLYKVWVYDPLSPKASGVNPKVAFDVNGAGLDDSPDSLVTAGDKLYFNAYVSSAYRTYVYDPGQPAGASNPLLLGATFLETPIAHGDKIYSACDLASFGDELCVYDTTQPAGASNPQVVDIQSGSGDSGANGFAVLDGKIYMRASVTATGAELRVLDPSQPTGASNPSLVADLVSGTGHSYPRELMGIGGKLYFVANTTATGAEMWEYDPSQATGASNPKLIEIAAGTASSDPYQFTGIGGKVYFRAGNSTVGNELFVYDPSAPLSASNPSALDLDPGAAHSNAYGLAAVDGLLYLAFSAGGSTHWAKLDPAQAISPGTNPSSLGTLDSIPSLSALTEFYQ